MMTPLAWMYALLVAALLVAFGEALDVMEFLRNVEAILEMDQLRQFKNLVRRQMYLALGRLLLLWGAFFVGLYIVLTGQLRGTPLVVLVVLVAGLFLLRRWLASLREQSRSLPAADKGLEGLYQAVGHVWQQKHLPDF